MSKKSSAVQVAIRVRPFNKREKDAGKDTSCVMMQNTQTILDTAYSKTGKPQVCWKSAVALRSLPSQHLCASGRVVWDVCHAYCYV